MFIRRLITSLTILLIISGCSTLPPNYDRLDSYALTNTQKTSFGTYVTKQRASHPGKDGFITLDNGLDAFVARALLIQKAEASIDVQYYKYIHDM